MADFEIKLVQLTMASSEFDKIQREINSISQQVGSVMGSVRSNIRANLNFSQTKKTLCSNIDNCATDMSQLSKAIREAVQYYMGHEKNVAQKSFGKTVKVSSKSTKSQEKSNWDKFKEGLTKAVVGTTKAVKKTVKNIASGTKKIAKNLWDGIKSGAEKTWNRFKDGCGVIKDGFASVCNYIKENYDNHGFFYKVAQYGKAAVSIVGCTAVIAASLASIFGSGGLSTPAAITSIVYSINGIANSVTDVVNVTSGEYDKVGKTNYLKTGLTEGAGWVGKQLGNENIGEAVGTGLYYAGSIYTTVANLGNALDKVKQVKNVKLGDAFSSAKKFPVKELLKTDVAELKLQTALMKSSKDYKALFDFADNVKLYNETLGKVVSVGFGVSDASLEVFSVATGKDYSSKVLDFYKNATEDNVVAKTYNTYDGYKGTYEKSKDIWDTLKNMYKSDVIIRGMAAN